MGSLAVGMQLPNTDLLVSTLPGSAPALRLGVRLYDLPDPFGLTLALVNQPGSAPPLADLAKWQAVLQVHSLGPATAPHQAEFERIFGAGPAFLLIRPDGYVGVCGEPSEITAASHGLGQWLASQ